VSRGVTGRWFGMGVDAEFVTTLTFTPPTTQEYRIVIGAGWVTPERRAPLTHTLQIVESHIVLTLQGQLNPKDALYQRRGTAHKLHTVKLEAGKTYQVDMVSVSFDSFLVLEDAKGNELLQDDDSGGNQNARLTFRPERTDTYRIVATIFDPAGPPGPGGPYHLTVVEVPGTGLATARPLKK
jgi:hypothetical protein